MLKRAKKSKNDLINAEEGEDHFTDISSVGEHQNLAINQHNVKKKNKNLSIIIMRLNYGVVWSRSSGVESYLWIKNRAGND